MRAVMNADPNVHEDGTSCVIAEPEMMRAAAAPRKSQPHTVGFDGACSWMPSTTTQMFANTAPVMPPLVYPDCSGVGVPMIDGNPYVPLYACPVNVDLSTVPVIWGVTANQCALGGSPTPRNTRVIFCAVAD